MRELQTVTRNNKRGRDKIEVSSVRPSLCCPPPLPCLRIWVKKINHQLFAWDFKSRTLSEELQVAIGQASSHFGSAISEEDDTQRGALKGSNLAEIKIFCKHGNKIVCQYSIKPFVLKTKEIVSNAAYHHQESLNSLARYIALTNRPCHVHL